ncbi:MAG: hypothetical protein Q7R52_04120 [archaeon]|nr:hypothetical protein [archaeon]
MEKKGFLQIPFAWLFAIIVGIVILFLAIYFSVKIIDLGQTESDVTMSKKIGILFNPMETGIESAKTTVIGLNSETRIYNDCSESGNFGTQSIKVSQKSFGKFTSTNMDSKFQNKYIFSNKSEEGIKFFVFSMPFNYPFKVADLMIITSKEYCFIDAPDNVKEQISNIQNIKIENCSAKSVKVCFGYSSNCNVKVNMGQGVVEKGSDKLYFYDNLLYAAIFSDKDIYECQTKRLMKRTEILANIYNAKSSELTIKGCESTDIGLKLISLGNNAQIENSEGLILNLGLIEEINQKNEVLGECRLW